MDVADMILIVFLFFSKNLEAHLLLLLDVPGAHNISHVLKQLAVGHCKKQDLLRKKVPILSLHFY